MSLPESHQTKEIENGLTLNMGSLVKKEVCHRNEKINAEGDQVDLKLEDNKRACPPSSLLRKYENCFNEGGDTSKLCASRHIDEFQNRNQISQNADPDKESQTYQTKRSKSNTVVRCPDQHSDPQSHSSSQPIPLNEVIPGEGRGNKHVKKEVVTSEYTLEFWYEVGPTSSPKLGVDNYSGSTRSSNNETTVSPSGEDSKTSLQLSLKSLCDTCNIDNQIPESAGDKGKEMYRPQEDGYDYLKEECKAKYNPELESGADNGEKCTVKKEKPLGLSINEGHIIDRPDTPSQQLPETPRISASPALSPSCQSENEEFRRKTPPTQDQEECALNLSRPKIVSNGNIQASTVSHSSQQKTQNYPSDNITCNSSKSNTLIRSSIRTENQDVEPESSQLSLAASSSTVNYQQVMSSQNGIPYLPLSFGLYSRFQAGIVSQTATRSVPMSYPHNNVPSYYYPNLRTSLPFPHTSMPIRPISQLPLSTSGIRNNNLEFNSNNNNNNNNNNNIVTMTSSVTRTNALLTSVPRYDWQPPVAVSQLQHDLPISPTVYNREQLFSNQCQRPGYMLNNAQSNMYLHQYPYVTILPPRQGPTQSLEIRSFVGRDVGNLGSFDHQNMLPESRTSNDISASVRKSPATSGTQFACLDGNKKNEIKKRKSANRPTSFEKIVEKRKTEENENVNKLGSEVQVIEKNEPTTKETAIDSRKRKFMEALGFVDPTKVKLSQDDDDFPDCNEFMRDLVIDADNTSDEDWIPDEEDAKKSEKDLKRPIESLGDDVRFVKRKKTRGSVTRNNETPVRRGRPTAKAIACPTCGKVFHGSYHLKRHEMSHTENRPFVCSVCGKRFKQKAHLQGHEMIHRREKNQAKTKVENPVPKTLPTIKKCPGKPKKIYSEKELNCTICNKGFKTFYRLKRHVQSHTDERPFSCRICGKCFKQTGHRNEHEANHEKNRRKFLCNTCGVIFRCRSSFNNHLKSHRTEEDAIQQSPFRNGRSGVSNKDESVNEQEEDSYSSLSNENTVGRTGYDCPYCSDKFSTAQGLNRHLDSHIEVGQRLHVQPYTCKHCSRAFTYKHNLLKHMLSHRAPEKYAIYYKSKLEQHVASGKPSYKCSVCSKLFIRKETLVKHAKIHTGCKPYKCVVCFKDFSQNVHLKVHMRKHTGNRPFQCKRCNRGFIDSTSLAKHIEYEACIAENVFYVCKLCDKRHYYLGSIKLHLQKNHHKKDCEMEDFIHRIQRQRQRARKAKNANTHHACEVCQSMFTEKGNLVRHVKRQHEDLMKMFTEDENIGEYSYVCVQHDDNASGSCGFNNNTSDRTKLDQIESYTGILLDAEGKSISESEGTSPKASPSNERSRIMLSDEKTISLNKTYDILQNDKKSKTTISISNSSELDSSQLIAPECCEDSTSRPNLTIDTSDSELADCSRHLESPIRSTIEVSLEDEDLCNKNKSLSEITSTKSFGYSGSIDKRLDSVVDLNCDSSVEKHDKRAVYFLSQFGLIVSDKGKRGNDSTNEQSSATYQSPPIVSSSTFDSERTGVYELPSATLNNSIEVSYPHKMNSQDYGESGTSAIDLTMKPQQQRQFHSDLELFCDLALMSENQRLSNTLSNQNTTSTGVENTCPKKPVQSSFGIPRTSELVSVKMSTKNVNDVLCDGNASIQAQNTDNGKDPKDRQLKKKYPSLKPWLQQLFGQPSRSVKKSQRLQGQKKTQWSLSGGSNNWNTETLHANKDKATDPAKVNSIDTNANNNTKRQNNKITNVLGISSRPVSNTFESVNSTEDELAIQLPGKGTQDQHLHMHRRKRDNVVYKAKQYTKAVTVKCIDTSHLVETSRLSGDSEPAGTSRLSGDYQLARASYLADTCHLAGGFLPDDDSRRVSVNSDEAVNSDSSSTTLDYFPTLVISTPGNSPLKNGGGDRNSRSIEKIGTININTSIIDTNTHKTRAKNSRRDKRSISISSQSLSLSLSPMSASTDPKTCVPQRQSTKSTMALQIKHGIPLLSTSSPASTLQQNLSREVMTQTKLSSQVARSPITMTLLLRSSEENAPRISSAPTLRRATTRSMRTRLSVAGRECKAPKEPFPCQTCGKCFNARHQLKRHELTHTEIRPYGCPECGRAFRQKVHLSDHLKRHGGQRPFACMACGKRFVLKNELKQHTKNYCRKTPGDNAEQVWRQFVTVKPDRLASVSSDGPSSSSPSMTSMAANFNDDCGQLHGNRVPMSP